MNNLPGAEGGEELKRAYWERNKTLTPQAIETKYEVKNHTLRCWCLTMRVSLIPRIRMLRSRVNALFSIHGYEIAAPFPIPIPPAAAYM